MIVGTILGFVGWMFAWVFSWLFFLLAGIGVGFYLKSFVDPALHAKGAAEQLLSALTGLLGKKKEPKSE